MLSRVFNTPRRISPPQAGESSRNRSNTINEEYEDFIFGFVDDIPLISFNNSIHDSNSNNQIYTNNASESTQLTLRQVLRASVGVMGESPLGMTEKVVLSGGIICALKRFRTVSVRKREFARRIVNIARVGNQCQHLVPITSYLYAKRIKFVVCNYYPMGSLADLLSGERDQGQTALEWNHRCSIIQSIAKAILYIHSQSPPRDHKECPLNVHGNIKSSNVMINIDFSACLSDYGFVQVADTGQGEVLPATSPPREQVLEYEHTVSQKSDVYNFGVVVLDILGWPHHKNFEMFEFGVGGREQASKVLEIALTCTERSPDARPCIAKIISRLDKVLLHSLCN